MYYDIISILLLITINYITNLITSIIFIPFRLLLAYPGPLTLRDFRIGSPWSLRGAGRTGIRRCAPSNVASREFDGSGGSARDGRPPV